MNATEEITMTMSTQPADSEKLKSLFMDDALLQGGPEGATRWIARVLRQAHRKASAVNPNDARGVLYVAHCFADELAIANPRFDRLRFIREATEQQP
jgi:hypothetical protein